MQLFIGVSLKIAKLRSSPEPSYAENKYELVFTVHTSTFVEKDCHHYPKYLIEEIFSSFGYVTFSLNKTINLYSGKPIFNT